jgi:hypothetical protein
VQAVSTIDIPVLDVLEGQSETISAAHDFGRGGGVGHLRAVIFAQRLADGAVVYDG